MTVKVFHDGNVSGLGYSTKYNESFTASGTINNTGKANITIGKVSNGSSFKGQFTNMVASGTWESDWIEEWSGKWVLFREN